MKALLLLHNLPERGSYFRAHEIAMRLVQRGHHVQLGYVSNLKKYRPVYYPVQPDDMKVRPEEHDPRGRRSMLAKAGSAAPNVLVWAEYPYFTFYNDRQEGWGLFDNTARIRDATTGGWDLVYGFSHKPHNVLPALAAKMRGAKMVLDWSDWWGSDEGLFRQCVLPSNTYQSLPRPIRIGRRLVFELEDFLEPIVYRPADAVTLISEEFYRHPQAAPDLAQKSLVLHSGSPLDRIQPVDKEAARARLGLQFPPDAIVLGYAANFHMDERLLMQSFAHICEQRTNVHLLVVGADLEKTTPDIHRLTHDRIHHAGRQPFSRIGDYFGAADILVLPLTDVALNRARYPHKLSDYVAAGRPIVACDVGETGRILRRFHFGNLTPPDAEGFASGILAVADQPEQWQSQGARTRAVAEEHFNWDDLCVTLFDFLQQKTGLAF